MSALCSAVKQTVFVSVSPLNVLYEKNPEAFKSNCLWHFYVYFYIFKFYFMYFSSWYPVLPLSLFSLTFMWPFLLFSASFSFHQWDFKRRGTKTCKTSFGGMLCCAVILRVPVLIRNLGAGRHCWRKKPNPLLSLVHRYLHILQQLLLFSTQVRPSVLGELLVVIWIHTSCECGD